MTKDDEIERAFEGAEPDIGDKLLLDNNDPKYRKPKPAMPVRNLKVAKMRHDPFQGVSSWRLLGELIKRHFVHFQILGFWVIVIAFILYKAKVI